MRVLPVLALLAALGLALAPAPASAWGTAPVCPCWNALPAVDPVICYENASAPPINLFAYFAPPYLFVQVTDTWCRANGAFRWLSPSERMACMHGIRDACGFDHGAGCPG